MSAAITSADAKPTASHPARAAHVRPALHRRELTLADVTPAMSEFIPLARKSRADAERAVDELWSPAAMAA